MKSVQRAMISKDIKEVIGSKETLIPMIIVPMVMMFLLPLGLVIGAKYGASYINGMDHMVKVLGSKFHDLNKSQLVFEIGLNYMFPALFLLIPIMASSIIGPAAL